MHVSLEKIADALERSGLLVDRRGTLPATVSGVTDDSRAVRAGTLFLAVRGSARDGHEFLDAAAQAGAGAAMVEDATRTSLPALVVRESRRAAAVVACAAYGDPARELQLFGVTGTNGKTTSVGIIRHLLDSPATPAASLGTLGVLLGSEGRVLPGGAGLTTPGPVELQRVLRALRDEGISRVAMEVSSHALDQRRVEGLEFDVALFTNLTRDHLDYHQTMEAYLDAKLRLVELLKDRGTAVTNADDDAWLALPPVPRRVTYGIENDADLRAVDIRMNPEGSNCRLATRQEAVDVTIPLIGEFNISNALGAAAVAWSVGMTLEEIAERLRTLPQVPGRLEVVGRSPTVLRDYAHTPDALERALGAVRPFTPGRLVLVFGCGGDRDPGKRPLMGQIAARDADVVIVTSDNPRTEDPHQIIHDIEAGMGEGEHEAIEDRREAIARAIELAGSGDVVLLAGKGHENYQIRGTESLPFDEKEIVGEILASRGR